MSVRAVSMNNLGVVYAKGNAYRINYAFMSKDETLMKMFGVNKSPVEIISEGAFGGTYFRDIYSGVNGKWYCNSRKKFKFLDGLDKKLYTSSYYQVNVNKYGVKCGTSLRFWENKGWINEFDPYRWFQWYCRYW